MGRSAVLAEVARDALRGGVVVVQDERGDRVAAGLREVPDQPVDRPVADLGVLPLREPNQLVEAPDQIGQRASSAAMILAARLHPR